MGCSQILTIGIHDGYSFNQIGGHEFQCDVLKSSL